VKDGKLLEGQYQTISPDEEFVLTTKNNILYLWRIGNGELLNQWKEYKEKIKDVQFSAGEKLLFLVLTDKTLRIWDIENKVPIYELPGFGGSFYDDNYRSKYFLSPDNKLVFLVSEDKTLYIFDMESRTRIYHQLEKYGEAVLSIPDSQSILLASENQILIWDTQSRTTLYQINKLKYHNVTMVKFSSNKQRLASADKTAILWRSADFWQPTENVIEYTQEKVWKTLAPQQREELLLHFLGITQEEWDTYKDYPEQRIRYVRETVWPKFTLAQQQKLSLQVLRLLWQTTNWERVSLDQFRQLSAWLIEPFSEQNLEDQEKLPEYYNISLLHRLEEQWQNLNFAQQTQVLNQVVALTWP
jgi:WD40 repeat protein